MSVGFVGTLALLGAVVAALSGASGFLRGRPVGVAVVAVAIGLGLGYGGAIQVDPTSPTVRELVELTMIFSLFSNGLLVEEELFRRR